jgi:tungstate transport system substrate-binding protein
MPVRRDTAGTLVVLLAYALVCIAAAGCRRSSAPAGPEADAAPPQAAAVHEVVRCAVIGGMVTSGLWTALSQRYEAETGDRVELTVSGNKQMIVDPMRKGHVDLITLHASDAIVNLVADGYAMDPQPWARNDQVIVGPADDPARVRGMGDAVAALAKIAASKSAFVAHRGSGSMQLLKELLDEGHVALDDDRTFRVPPSQSQETVLELASAKHAYSLVGRIPFKVGKMQGKGMEILVQGDERLRRPYMVAIADPKRAPGAHVAAARRLAAYLRSPATQAWLATYTSATFGGAPPFFPVVVGDPDGGAVP